MLVTTEEETASRFDARSSQIPFRSELPTGVLLFGPGQKRRCMLYAPRNRFSGKAISMLEEVKWGEER